MGHHTPGDCVSDCRPHCGDEGIFAAHHSRRDARHQADVPWKASPFRVISVAGTGNLLCQQPLIGCQHGVSQAGGDAAGRLVVGVADRLRQLVA